MSDTVSVILLLLVVFLLLFLVSWLSTRGAIPSVIKVFRKHNAIGIDNAKTREELGLKAQSVIDHMWKFHDYKPDALQTLINARVVQKTEDNRLYLSEVNLADSKWKSH